MVTAAGDATVTSLPDHASVGVVCAHPDDESFGLGAVIAALVDRGTRVELVSLTRGEASSLGAGSDLAERRAAELRAAAAELGIAEVRLASHPDGHLAEEALEELVEEVVDLLGEVDALLTFDHGGVSGHPDHQRATDVCILVGVRLGLPVLGWTVPTPVADQLREDFAAPFVGRGPDQVHHRIQVDRSRQRAAMACHASQQNPVPYRRLELLGSVEYLRVLHAPGRG
ncbi:MAG: PIG-L deacetylase family protein [Nitriliruptoraceae bacterium]